MSAHKDLQQILHFRRLPLTKEKKIILPFPLFSAGIVTKPLSLTDGRNCHGHAWCQKPGVDGPGLHPVSEGEKDPD